ncbi:hypothetical protein GGR44_001792 [Sphingobium fontiphilum]|uniref:Uncharacterized protein n=1 Tax=Sphingobium fontiphilum TaxID=944425 RepID=A0A7W6DFG9_9SPHN|nr:hypothetical protein [Sphingobium fontiphilum]MBB3982133.1 hypothetical protein [Sphingobium fontiphilum]
MPFDFCTISTGLWAAIGLASITAGAFIGFTLATVFSKSSFGLSVTSGQNLAGGCLLPIAFGLIAGFSVSHLLPNDPCDGAFTPDAGFVPPYVFISVAGAAIALFWLKIRRR